MLPGIGELRLRRVDANECEGFVLLGDQLREGTIATAHIQPALALVRGDPVEKFLAGEATPYPHEAVVAGPVGEADGFTGHGHRDSGGSRLQFAHAGTSRSPPVPHLAKARQTAIGWLGAPGSARLPGLKCGELQQCPERWPRALACSAVVPSKGARCSTQGFVLAFIPAKAPHTGGLPQFAGEQHASAAITSGLRPSLCNTSS